MNYSFISGALLMGACLICWVALPESGIEALASSGFHQSADEKDDKKEEKPSTTEEHLRLAGETGNYRWRGKLDYTMGRVDPLTGEKGPKFIQLLGESTSQMILGDQFLLTRTLTQGKKSAEYQIHGYRSDLKQFFVIGLEELRTPFAYRSGTEKEGERILKDPSGYVTQVTRFDLRSKTSESEVYLGEVKTPFLTLSSEPKKGREINLLSRLIASKPIPKVFNQSDERDDPAENYSQEHLLLHKFAGDMIADSEEVEPRAGRIICDGRFLASLSLSDIKEKKVSSLTLIGFDSSRSAFQMFVIRADSPNPEYYEGDFDGVTLTFRNPFAGEGKADRPVITYNFAPKGPGFSEVDDRNKNEEKQGPVEFMPSRNFRRK
ncbi:MAG: hypothetical protein CBC13_08055 [Planctomycetia bacterium TMED53]|nr:MAG: hypothetical protein CBC13_08055 [Planctomycetia bacterium TMED53]